jgi:drug/metabolite transporter (DMT)-like permease
LKTYLKLLAVAFFWGGTFVAGRSLAGDAHPVSAAFFRFAIASICLLLAVCKVEGRLPKLNVRQGLAVAALGLTGVFAYNLFFFNGLALIGAGRAALIIALNPVAITLCSALIYRERLPLSRIVGIPLSVVGALVVITRGHPLMILSGGVGRGELLISGCVLSWTLYSIIGKTAMRGLSPLAAVCWSSIVGTFLLLIPALFYGSFAEALHFSWPVWLSIGYLGLFGTVIGFLWYFEGIQTIGPSRAAVFINFVPVSGVLLATLLLGEPLDISLLGGGFLVVLGAYLANSPKPFFWRRE